MHDSSHILSALVRFVTTLVTTHSLSFTFVQNIYEIINNIYIRVGERVFFVSDFIVTFAK